MSAASELAARRKRVEKPCEVCGKPFTALARARTCSSACRSRLHYYKKKPSP